jgi:hypothetical protein
MDVMDSMDGMDAVPWGEEAFSTTPDFYPTTREAYPTTREAYPMTREACRTVWLWRPNVSLGGLTEATYSAP